ncbi:MAG TPA: Wzz/FepE/Etk N-terminal domain-containing protein [Jatrophihabitantaceae bacterium]|nr:Wzz/FepE/Etk N-terminal domain-containing protein [Jatrophihabitantaceae bacterium]
MHARSLAVALWRRRWTALLVLVLVAAAAAGWLALAPRRYTAVATITAVPAPGAVQSGVDDLERTLATLANSRPVLQDVAAKVGPRRSMATLRREISGERVGATMLIRVRVQDGNPDVAKLIANSVVDALPLHDPTGGKVVFTDAGRAVRPASPSAPDWLPVILIAAGAGIVLAILAALIRDSAAARVRHADELADLTGAQVLGGVSAPADVAAISVADPGPLADQFRRLRVALEFAGSEVPTRAVIVSTVTADRASGWFVANLAATLAQVRHRVLLIDADTSDRPRHPVLAHKGDGLAEVLAQTVSLEDAVVSSGVPGVCVLPLGDRAMLAAEPLLELHFHRTLARLGPDAFDIVLVSAPPLDASDDARVMAAGNSLIVAVASASARPKLVRREIGEVHRMRLRLIGLVLMRSARKA